MVAEEQEQRDKVQQVVLALLQVQLYWCVGILRHDIIIRK